MKGRKRSLAMTGVIILLVGHAGASAGEDENVDTVRFTTDDRVEIVADYYAPPEAATPAPIVIMLHMYKSDRSAWKPLATRFQAEGYAALAIDMRGHGQSGGAARSSLQDRVRGRDPSLFRSMHRDIAAAHTWLGHREECDLTRVAVVGASVGCSVALDYAARDPSVDVVVAMTPGVDYLGVDSKGPIQALGDRPVLLLATEEEREATDALAALNPAARSQIVGPGRVHGTRMLGVVKDIESTIVGFVKRGVGNASPAPVPSPYGSRLYYPNEESARQAAEHPSGALRWYSSPQEAEARGVKKAVGSDRDGA
ncbi:MAG: alpha/beta fold hydrolase [Phycisphaerae bacterium]|jgi:pimeloyl-ACP methyl ester carboxylesterase